MRTSREFRRMALSGLILVAMAGCSDLLGPEDPRYEAECVVYVAGGATKAEIRDQIHKQLTADQRARCRPPHVRMVNFG